MAKKYRKWLNPKGSAFVAVDDGYLLIGDCSRSVCLEFVLSYSWHKEPLNAEKKRVVTEEYKAYQKKLDILRKGIDVLEDEMNAHYDRMMSR